MCKHMLFQPAWLVQGKLMCRHAEGCSQQMRCAAAGAPLQKHGCRFCGRAGRTPARASTRRTSPGSSPCSRTTLPPTDAVQKPLCATTLPSTSGCRAAPRLQVQCVFKYNLLRRIGCRAYESLFVHLGEPHPHIATVPCSSGAFACSAPVQQQLGATAAACAVGFPPTQLHMACRAVQLRYKSCRLA